jgi:hypothetical protein
MVTNYNFAIFCEYFWLTTQALLNKIAAGKKCKDDLPEIINQLLLP